MEGVLEVEFLSCWNCIVQVHAHSLPADISYPCLSLMNYLYIHLFINLVHLNDLRAKSDSHHMNLILKSPITIRSGCNWILYYITAIIAKYGPLIMEWALLYQVLLRYSIVNSFCADDWTAEWAIIVSSDRFTIYQYLSSETNLVEISTSLQ